MDERLVAFKRLLDIMDELREKCPWDREQTYESIRNLTIEETYELADAITLEDREEMKKELGDILLHIVFYAKIGSERGDFDIKSIIDSLCEKLIFRHPHVFGEEDVNGSSNKVKQNWEELKQKEKNRKRVLGGVPNSLPALIKANRIQEKVRSVGFDWDLREQIWDKVEEEMNEVKEEIKLNDKTNIEKEFGDLLFSVVNAARLYDVDPENALEHTNQKFMRRFQYLEDKTIRKDRSLRDMNLDEMNEIWEEAKQFDKK